MKLKRRFVLFLSLIVIVIDSTAADIKINEIAASNHSCYYDENMETPDWFELYNNGDSPVNLKGYRVSDNNNFEEAWEIPDRRVEPGERLMVYASGLDRRGTDNYIMESSGWGFGYYDGTDGIRFDYIEIQGDFEIEAKFNAMRFAADNAKAGLMVREKLTEDCRYGAMVCESPRMKGYKFHFRTREREWPKIVPFWNVEVEYPSYYIKLKRRGDSLFGYINADGVHWYCGAEINLPMPEGTIYLGIAFGSGNRDQMSKLTVSELKINGEDFSPEKFKHIEFNAGEEGRSYLSRELHTDFKLNRQSESLFLWNSRGELIDKVIFTDQITDISYSRFPDGEGEFSFCPNPTPEKENLQGCPGRTADPIFSNKGGWFEGNKTVTLSVNDDKANIYYTKDGSEPDSGSIRYTGETITIDTTTLIRARAFNDALLPGRIVSNTYFIDEDIPLQVISLSADPEDLWNKENGIFVKDNLFKDIEIPVNFELWGDDKELKYESGAGARVHGHASRYHPQKSVRLYARSIYGEKYFDYPFFGDKGMDKYDHLIVRNGGTEWKSSIIRDGICAVLAEDFHNLDAMAFSPAIVFLNGEYWGIENIRERIHEDQISLKYDIPKNTIDLYEDANGRLHGDGIKLFNMYDSIETMDFNKPGSYEFINRSVDIENIMEYAIIEFYNTNLDWPYKNLKYWRSDSLDGKWRWILNDLDGTSRAYMLNHNMLKFTLKQKWPFPTIFSKFLENMVFRHKFINKSADLMNTVLQAENVVPIVDSLANIIRPQIIRHRKRWDSAAIDWEDEIESIKKFYELRLNYLPDHYAEYFNLTGTAKLEINANHTGGEIRVNSINIDEFPWNGIYFQGVPVELEATPPEGMEFKRWISDRSIFSDTMEARLPQLKVNLPENVTLKAEFEDKIHQYEGKIIINEIMYKSPPDERDSKDWIELYNADDYDINISGWKIKDDDDSHIFIFDQETNIKSDEYMVICRDINNFESVHPNVEHYPKDFTYGFGTDDAVRLYDSNDELVDKVEYLPSSPWPENCVETGLTMELKNPGLDNSLPESWQASYVMNGTPGRKNSVYTGVMEYSSAKDLNLKVYPNPAVDIFMVTFENPEAGYVNIKLRDAMGNEIYSSGSRFYDSGRNTRTLNISKINDLQPGLYFLSVNKQSRKSVAKIVILP